MNLSILFFSSLLHFSFAIDKPEPFDFVEDSLLRYRDLSLSPCDNFFRHACPLNSPENLINYAFRGIDDYLRENHQDNYWHKVDIMTEYDSFSEKAATLNNTQSMVEFYTEIFNSVCLTDIEKSANILEKIIDTATSHPSGSDSLPQIYFRRKKDNSFKCDEMSQNLRANLREVFRGSTNTSSEFFNLLVFNLDHIKTEMDGIDGILKMDVRKGIEETGKMVESTLEILKTLIKETPWAKNKNLVETLNKLALELKIYDNYGEAFQDRTNNLYKIETTYKKCKEDIGVVENGKLFCFIYTSTKFEEIHYDRFSVIDNAFNMHPIVAFGLPNYYYAQHGKEMSAKLGYTGATVGHEIGHTFFDNHLDFEFIPKFSKNVEDCVQKQFNATCTEFKEKSCFTNSTYLEENGADIFGIHLSYQLLEDYYGPNLQKKIERLGVTHQQLFFYSYAYMYCTGVPDEPVTMDGHSANNIRANVLVHHPGFKEAFQCSDDSRMMKSKTEECFIYGKNAPETRKLKNTKNL